MILPKTWLHLEKLTQKLSAMDSRAARFSRLLGEEGQEIVLVEPECTSVGNDSLSKPKAKAKSSTLILGNVLGALKPI